MSKFERGPPAALAPPAQMTAEERQLTRPWLEPEQEREAEAEAALSWFMARLLTSYGNQLVRSSTCTSLTARGFLAVFR